MANAFVSGQPAAAAGDLRRPVMVWQWQVRLFHWCFALSTLVLFATGLYVAHPFTTPTPEASDSHTMAWMRLVHFTAAAVFCVAFFWRVYWFWFGNRYARSGFPYVWRADWWRAVVRQATDYVRLDFRRVHVGHNALAGLSYTIVPVFGGLVMMFTGLALFSESNPGGFWDGLVGWVLPLLGGSFRTHMWHHLFAWLFLVFAIVHVYIVLLDANRYGNGLVGSMFSGRKFQPVDQVDDHDD